MRQCLKKLKRPFKLFRYLGTPKRATQSSSIRQSISLEFQGTDSLNRQTHTALNKATRFSTVLIKFTVWTFAYFCSTLSLNRLSLSLFYPPPKGRLAATVGLSKIAKNCPVYPFFNSFLSIHFSLTFSASAQTPSVPDSEGIPLHTLLHWPLPVFFARYSWWKKIIMPFSNRSICDSRSTAGNAFSWWTTTCKSQAFFNYQKPFGDTHSLSQTLQSISACS